MTERAPVSATLAEIAAALGISRIGALKRAAKEAWTHQTETRGGGKPTKIYPVATLPMPVREALAARELKALAGTLAAPVAAAESTAVTVVPARLPAVLGEDHHHAKTAKQRIEESARRAVLAGVDRLIQASGCGKEAALTTLLTTARASGELAETLKLARDGRGRKGARDDGLPSVRSLKRWLTTQTHGGDLAPAVREKDMAVKPWYALAYNLAQRPQGSSRRWIAEQIAAQWLPAWGGKVPSYDVVAKFFRDKASRFDVLVGRHTGMDLKSQMPYQPRTREGLWPAMEAHADGWNTHFTAPHPVSGEFVTYEVWTAMDYATAYPTEPSFGLTESYEVIAKCLENYIRELGVPAVFQTDNTGSVKNDRFEFDGIASLQDRIGFKIVHPSMVAVGKGNSQANGLVENLHAWYDRECRELATYQAKGMDSLTLKRVKRITAKLAKATDLVERAKLQAEAEKAGKGIVFTSFQQAKDWFLGKVEKKRCEPSRGLPKIDDPETGRRRHMSPREALESFKAQGWKPVAMSEAEIIDAFRPHIRKTVQRGMVTPYAAQKYSHPDLVHHNGTEVMIAIDIMDPWQVWVKDLEGRLICVAAYIQGRLPRPKSMYDDSMDKRDAAQIKRRENQIEQIEARREAPAIEHISGEVIPFGPIAIPGAKPRAEPVERMSNEEFVEKYIRPAKAEAEADATPSVMRPGEDFAMYLYRMKHGDKTPNEEVAAR